MSSDGERSPKRQRRSYSPASPTELPETKGFVNQPQTPPPSVHMSPSWQQQCSANVQGGGSVTFPTPPSTAGFQSQQRSVEGAEGGQETPTESEQRQSGEGETDAEMTDRREEAVEEETAGDVSMSSVKPEHEVEDAEHRRTDHERQEDADTSNGMGSPPAAPRLYKLRSKPIAPARPHPASNIIDLYDLTRIQASVARRDAAGNKINKLRKSYEGKVKALSIEGRPKATKGDAALQGLVDGAWDWDIGGGITGWQDRTKDLPLGDADAEEEVLSKLSSALSMKPGWLPKGEHEGWKNILSLDEPRATPVVAATKPGIVPNAALTKTAPGVQPFRPRSPAFANGVARPERSGKKRRYDESSYSGYQEGYDDDGYSTGDVDSGRRGSASKRQKMGPVGGPPPRKVGTISS